jgi:hypothetical protein
MQNELDERKDPNADSEDPRALRGTALVFAIFLNQNLPKRFRLSDSEIGERINDCAAMPMRTLLKDLYRAWQRLGKPTRRGALFPSLGKGKQLIEMIRETAQKALRSL